MIRSEQYWSSGSEQVAPSYYYCYNSVLLLSAYYYHYDSLFQHGVARVCVEDTDATRREHREDAHLVDG